MPYNTYRASQGALAFDAYYSDEFGVVNDATNTTLDTRQRSGFHKNRFTSVATINAVLAETSRTLVTNPIPNKANPAFTAGLKYRQTNAPADINTDRRPLFIFFSDSVLTYWKSLQGKDWLVPINFTLFYAVGHELNRHGIRSAFEKKTNFQAIILVPGIEPARWGRAIGTDQIDTILQNFFRMPKIPYKIKVLAAYSTGINGFNQTLLNELVSLKEVERVVIYDCLYALSSGSTAEALSILKSRAGSKLKIVVYKTSENGNSYFPKGSFRLAVPAKNRGLIDNRGIIENLFRQPNYITLICFRALEAAEKDKIITIPTMMRSAFDDMKRITPPRGTIISNRTCYQYVYGSLPKSSNNTLYETWRTTNQGVLQAFYRFIGSKDISTPAKLLLNQGSIRDLLWNNMLPGWPGKQTDGEEKHDLLLPEFAWEYLPWNEPRPVP